MKLPRTTKCPNCNGDNEPHRRMCWRCNFRLAGAPEALTKNNTLAGSRACALERMVGLLARWRERADRLQKMALEYEEEDDCKNAIDCASAAQEIRDCALDLESAMAVKKPNDGSDRLEPANPRSDEGTGK